MESGRRTIEVSQKTGLPMPWRGSWCRHRRAGLGGRRWSL